MNWRIILIEAHYTQGEAENGSEDSELSDTWKVRIWKEMDNCDKYLVHLPLSTCDPNSLREDNMLKNWTVFQVQDMEVWFCLLW